MLLSAIEALMEENSNLRSDSYSFTHGVKVKEPLSHCKETLISCIESKSVPKFMLKL